MHEDSPDSKQTFMGLDLTPLEKQNAPDLGRHLLVALSGHAKAGAGLEFVSHFFTQRENVNLTLFHIPAIPGAVWAEEASYETLGALEHRSEASVSKGQRLVAEARRRLMEAGFDPERITDRVVTPQMSKGHDIIRAAASGSYDAVVLGRRAQVGLGEVMDKSVSRDLIEDLNSAISFPLWICRLPEPGRRNVLLCVDGSPPSDRITDHVGFMLASEPGHTVTVFHVCPGGDKCTAEAEAVTGRAVDMLVEAGMPPDRIIRTIRPGTNPARIIEAEYDAGGYAAVAIGSSGRGRSLWDKIFVGSVARTVFRQLSGAALWVCF
jgi:nucleotide-binding universal stress UspA family protein